MHIEKRSILYICYTRYRTYTTNRFRQEYDIQLIVICQIFAALITTQQRPPYASTTRVRERNRRQISHSSAKLCRPVTGRHVATDSKLNVHPLPFPF